MLTKEDCKRILFKVGLKFGVSPKLISERLLDAQDKCDMLNGKVPIECLEVATQTWMDAGQPDYAHGLTARMDNIKREFRSPQTHHEPLNVTLRKPFVDFSERNSCDSEG
jgi:hypothetical protein